MQHSVPRQAAFRAFGAVADGAERTFDRVGCSDALPVPGGEIKEGHHLFAVLLQAQRGLGVAGSPRAFNAGVIFSTSPERLMPSGNPQCFTVAIIAPPALPVSGVSSIVAVKMLIQMDRRKECQLFRRFFVCLGVKWNRNCRERRVRDLYYLSLDFGANPEKI